MSLMMLGVVGTGSLLMAQPAQVEPRTATTYDATWESLDTVRGRIIKGPFLCFVVGGAVTTVCRCDCG